jgi:hypothetical protein
MSSILRVGDLWHEAEATIARHAYIAILGHRALARDAMALLTLAAYALVVRSHRRGVQRERQ